ncbi:MULTISPECIES: DUF1697 domain-containing protein [unclassified Microcella]|uniref:DUF1697 domain-containing protein n=1 Tax=unclassified Microcella TaxID=2630066 RepID=UPI0012E34EF5|nr:MULTISPECIES: DUF1697 domain-containing protein [unclassified Microcella]
MRHVLLIRNVNVGQRGQPSTADLLDGVAAAGAVDAVSVQSNGTVVVESGDPSALAEAVEDALGSATGIRREVFALPMEVIEAIADDHGDRPDASRRELTVHAAPAVDPSTAAAESAQRLGGCCIVATGEHAGSAWAVVLNDVERQSNGTPVIERVAVTPATSRSLATLRRVVERFGDGGSVLSPT